MSLYIQNRISPYLELKLLGTIFSAVAYGIVIVLSGNCFHLLQKKHGIYSNRMRTFLLIYVTVMLLLSTWTLIQSICQLMQSMTLRSILPRYLMYLSIAIPLVIWGTEGFMIWRCVVLYQDVSKGPRIVVFVLLSLLSFLSFVFGIAVLVEGVTFVHELVYAYPVFISVSTLANVILSALIVFRLVYHRRYIRNALGAEHGSPYTNVITMCIESSTLMAIASTLYTILDFGAPKWGALVFALIPHICVISPLLIVYRVAIGRAVPSTLRPSEQVTGPIRFNISLSNPSGQEREV